MTPEPDPGVLEARARQSRGTSGDAIYTAASAALRRRGARGDVLDVGCGSGRFGTFIPDLCGSYRGVDAVRYDGFPDDAILLKADLDREPLPLADASIDVVVSLETVEHLESPRAFCRELVRVLRPGGWLLVTTPNQRSLLSLGSLFLKGHFSAFQDNNYPAHQTALLDTDLQRIARENALADIAIEFTCTGRMPLTARACPQALSRAFPRAFSDNVLLLGRKPA